LIFSAGETPTLRKMTGIPALIELGGKNVSYDSRYDR
jgi:hypothetical protein